MSSRTAQCKLPRSLRVSVILALVVLLAACGGGGGSSSGSDATKVTVDSGTVRGSSDGSVTSFKGIPYAKPPVGSLRWKPPQAVDAWAGERSATSFGPHCTQTGLTVSAVTGQEDCLMLNVWAPVRTTSDLLPVFVYLHEGGNLVGSGDYDLSRLAKLGPAVVVSLNYRLGPFGFLGHPAFAAEDAHGTTGNYGIMDQIAALQWVQRNIQQFGGDPARVLLGGYSAGAHDTAVLVTSPLAHGLFSRAVVMSHSWMVQRASVVANTAAVATRFLGCDGLADDAATRDCMRAKTAAEVVAVPGNGTSNMGADPSCATAGCRFNLASVDGYVLPKTPRQIVRDGNHNAVPMIIGSTSTEWTTTVQILGLSITSDADYLAIQQAQFGTSLGQAAYNLYPPSAVAVPPSGYTAQTWAYVASMGDIDHHCPVRNMLNEIGARQTQPLWQYVWAHGASAPYYAGHATDLPYFLQTYTPGSLSSDEEALAAAMSGSLLRFAATGDPGSPTWPAYTVASPSFGIWALPGAIQSGWRHPQCDALEAAGFDWEWFISG
jgi:para-nitrobenzyl esterase